MQTIPLSDILGVSRFNARRTPPSEADEAELAASILEHGVTQSLLLREEAGGLVALDGGRRYIVLRNLADKGEIPADHPVPYEMFHGSDEQAQEVSLISFVQRRDLHPVDEFERFAELRDDFGLDETSIARKTGKSLRFVKDRLRLARLAPVIRDAWRAGRLIAEQAKAFATSEEHADQAELFAEMVERHGEDLTNTNVDAREIVEQLMSDAVRDTDPRARFVGADAYAAAGGDLDAQLFTGETWFFDGKLLKRLAEEKLERLGAEIVAAEGWGWACYQHKDEYRWTDGTGGIEDGEGTYTDEENARLDEIEALPRAEQAQHDDEAAQIHARAAVRSVPAEQRAKQGVYLQLDWKGRVEVTRAVIYEPAPEEESADGAEPPAAPSRQREAARSAGTRNMEEVEAPPTPLPSSKDMAAAARAELDKAINAALREIISGNYSLALIIAVAWCGRSHGGTSVDWNGVHWRHKKDSVGLLRDLGMGFNPSLHRVLAAHRQDASALPIALAEAVGNAISVEKCDSLDEAVTLLTVAASLSDVAGALNRALDFEAFFKASARETALAAIREIDGAAAEADAKKLKKPELIRRAALLAKDRGWLPEPLREAVTASPKDVRSTAAAMVEAMAADDAAPAKKKGGKKKGKGNGTAGPAETVAERHTGTAPICADAAPQEAAADDDAAGDRDPPEPYGADPSQAAEAAVAREKVVAAIEQKFPILALFLRNRVDWGEGLAIKATELRAAYIAEFPDTKMTASSMLSTFKKAGVAFDVRADGFYWLGLSLKTADERQAAE